MTRNFDIAIVGSGTAGAASALLLARAGHRVTLYEQITDPKPVGAGILLQPSGMRVLDSLGLLEEILAHGARNDRLLGTNHRKRRVLDIRYRDCDKESFGLGLHRGALFSILWETIQATNIKVRTGVRVTHINQAKKKASLFQDGVELGEFDCIVVADGVRSQLRESLAIPYQVTPYPWGALWAMVPDDGLTPGVLRQWFHHAQKMLGLMPTGFAYQQMEQPVISLFWSLRADKLAEWRAAGLDAWKAEVLSLAPIKSVLRHIHSADQLTYAAYSDVHMPYWHERRVVCIGDCAHATSPQLGQGCNLALVDAMILARCFAPGDNVIPTLAAYSAMRKSHLNYYQTASKWLTPFFQSDSRLSSTLRDLTMGPVCRLPLIRSQMAQTLSGTKTGWLWGKLAE